MAAEQQRPVDSLSDDDEDEDVGMVAQQDDWDDWEGSEGEAEPTKSLFGPEVLKTPEEAIAHDASAHGFDIRQYATQEHLDDYAIFRCINFIRSEVAAGRDPLPSLKIAGSAAKSAWADSDVYLVPAMQDDPLLFLDYEECTAVASAGDQGPGDAGAGGASASSDAEVAKLKAENAALMDALTELRAICMPADMMEEAGPSTSERPAGAPAAAPASASATAAIATAALTPAAKEVDGAYFDSYSGFGIHKEMISDKPRTEGYQQALECNPSLMKGAKVMDVGCGTGILSLFAARAGAARVVAVDGSKRIAEYARKICQLNGLSSETGGPITVVHGKIEEIRDMPVDQVDVLVSEWMGYALLFETMLDTVLYARDHYLKPGGAVLPDIATIHVAGAGKGASGCGWWKDVYGFNMSPIEVEMLKGQQETANVLVVDKADLVTASVLIKELDLCTMKSEDQDFSVEFTLQRATLSPSSTPSEAPVEVHSIVLWFDTAFSQRFCSEVPVLLSTSPHAPPTHWAQTLLVLKEPVLLGGAAGLTGGDNGSETTSPACASCLTGRISMVRNRSKHRSLDISLEYKAELSDGRLIKHSSIYAMSVND